MQEKIYKLRLLRLLEFWIAPILIIAFMVFLGYEDYEKNSQVHIGKLVFYFVIGMIFLGPFVWLFLNHLKKMPITKLIFSDSSVSFHGENISKIIDYSEVIDVVEYSSNRYGHGGLLWSDIVKWQVRTENEEFLISSLIISKTNLKKYIKKEFGFKATYFPEF